MMNRDSTSHPLPLLMLVILPYLFSVIDVKKYYLASVTPFRADNGASWRPKRPH